MALPKTLGLVTLANITFKSAWPDSSGGELLARSFFGMGWSLDESVSRLLQQDGTTSLSDK